MNRCIMTITVGLLTGLAATSAQSWTASAPAPAVAFGTSGDLLGRLPAPHGLVGFDEVQGKTVLPLAGGWVNLQAAVPPRSYATLANSSSQLYVFAGLNMTTGQYLNDLWRYNPALGDWEIMTAGVVTGPIPRFGCKAAPFDNSWALLFFGGADAIGVLNDTWVMLPPGTAANPPFWVQQSTPSALVGRIRHCMARAPNGYAILFGGDNGAPLGDTWLFDVNGWMAYTGVGPPAAADCRMTYDPWRVMTVLVHPNGETWEWNGIVWRRVGATGAPTWSNPAIVFDDHFTTPNAGTVLAVQQAAAGTETYSYTPSPANFDTSSDLACSLPGMLPIELRQHQRSLPILGQSMHMRVTGLPQASILLGAYEFEVPNTPSIAIGCGCQAALFGAATIVDLLPYAGGPRDWLLPIANIPALVGVPIAAQGFAVNSASACWLVTTQRARLVPGL